MENRIYNQSRTFADKALEHLADFGAELSRARDLPKGYAAGTAGASSLISLQKSASRASKATGRGFGLMSAIPDVKETLETFSTEHKSGNKLYPKTMVGITTGISKPLAGLAAGSFAYSASATALIALGAGSVAAVALPVAIGAGAFWAGSSLAGKGLEKVEGFFQKLAKQ